MAEIIQLREFQAVRERANRRFSDQQSLECALVLMRENLAAVAARMRDAPEREQSELLDRVEKLSAMIRYGMHMLRSQPAVGL
jgi:hypothetical protein